MLFSDETLSLSGLPPELAPKPPELSAEPPEQRQVFLEATQLGEDLLAELELVARPVREKSRVASSVLQGTILTLCRGRYLGRRVLAQLLGRHPDDLLKRMLNPMVMDGKLKTAFPSASDPRQAYITVSQ